MSTVETIYEIVAKQLEQPIAELRKVRNLAEITLDSLDRVELLMALEEKFGVEIHDAEAATITTIEQLAALIDVKRAGSV